MYKKINYLLVIGTIITEYKEIFEELKEEDLYILINGEFSNINESNKDLFQILSEKELLKAIREKTDNKSLFGYSDIFFMIKEHYKKNPFFYKEEEKRKKFIEEMIDRINNNSLKDGVQSMLEYWNSEEIEVQKRKFL